jgi:hypothetical protein
MIIGPDFIWLHFPKCAGSSLEEALRELLADRKGIHFDPADNNNPSADGHHNIPQRRAKDSSFDPSGKKVLCGIRRLPSWILSRTHFEISRDPRLIPTKEMLVKGEFYEPNGGVQKADAYMGLFSKPHVDKWIRTENTAEDRLLGLSLRDGWRQQTALRFGSRMKPVPLSIWQAERFAFVSGRLKARIS